MNLECGAQHRFGDGAGESGGRADIPKAALRAALQKGDHPGGEKILKKFGRWTFGVHFDRYN
jgi:hypothetical protein